MEQFPLHCKTTNNLSRYNGMYYTIQNMVQYCLRGEALLLWLSPYLLVIYTNYHRVWCLSVSINSHMDLS
jgi:hypothetical protein